MQAARLKAESQGRKAKLANSYHELLEEFSSKDLRSVGNYSLGRLIGKGSFGKVYLATHKLTNGSKVVLKSANKDDSNLAREIHHHRQFIHPHIARLYEVIVTENLVWLVLEYCPGDELYNYLLNHGALPVEKVQKIFTQLVGAVTYVHNSQCVHRDLKLENILLDKNENVKLCDFGFTREYEGKASYLQTFCGTICYSAPEMLKGEKYAGEKVDVWSLGVILYALLSGELPFDEDDDNETRTKILTAEPKWPDYFSPEARSLLGILLSKRPLRRPALSDILAHPFLADFAPAQQVILKLQQPAPFTTPLEKETLERMRSAGVDTDQVIENVLARRCDPLAGWWTLLLEKEQRKQARRERKRKEKEAENRTSRRLSGASTRLERTAPILTGVNEQGQEIRLRDPPPGRGRKDRRSAHYPDLVLTDLPGLPENPKLGSPGSATPPPPIDKDSISSASSSRHRRPIPPPKESMLLRSARSRGSTLQLVTSNHDLLAAPPNGNLRPPRRKHQHAFINHLANWKHWLLDSAKQVDQQLEDWWEGIKSAACNFKDIRSPKARFSARGSKPPTGSANIYHAQQQAPLSFTIASDSSVDLPPVQYRSPRPHSKASSTSSNGSGTMPMSKGPIPPRSPHHSVKVLPATPTTGTFPSNIRVVRQAPTSTYNEVPWGNSFGSGSTGGLVFAKRKKNVFKGPMLNTSSPSPSGGGHTRTGSHSRSTSVAGKRSSEIIEEEDEDAVEEVEAFSPVIGPEEVEELFPATDTPGTTDRL
ncbi:uncharacterized protein L3040_009084 [Drepanopeziza brunnea f. sp. 'multigermtubi']|uniref:uncharacterized protein n=1 Tax=Drepanopeziza brunnea f. sp. 'multigermtubi' TaxID=698441 RepID=UPI0023874631|nr:hypothetical protein L3040_009084 [Drepanopeziza brunnea f. sp. 'multigermtubi']